MSSILINLPHEEVSDQHREAIAELAGDMNVVVTQDEDEITLLLDDIEIVVGHLNRSLLSRMPNLRWYQQWGAGADWIADDADAQQHPFILTNASGVHSIPISEHIFMYLLALARWLPTALRAQQAGTWVRPTPSRDISELAGKTMLLVGVGAIGGRTADIAKAMGIHVVGLRRNPDATHPSVERMVGPSELHDVLPEADFVVVTAPGTPETAHMFGAREFAIMKNSALFVNIGRGSTVDQTALADALRDGEIGGAGLDVFDPEPLADDSPLWSMENVIITGHYSGNTPRYSERAMEIFIDNLRRYRNGEELVNVVDKTLGY